MACPKETQTEPCLVEDTEMQTKDPYVFSQETQTDHPTMDTIVQIDVEDYIQIGYHMIQEVVEATIQTNHMETQEGETQKKETSAYIPLVREAFISRQQNELLKVQH